MVAQCGERVVHPEAVKAGKAKIPPFEELEGMGYFFKVLGDPTGSGSFTRFLPASYASATSERPWT